MIESESLAKIKASGQSQLAGLLDHVRNTTAQVLAEPELQNQSTALVRYVVDCFVHFAQAYFHAITAALDADAEVGAQQLYAYQQHRAIERLCGNWEALVPLLYATSDPRVDLLETLVSAALPNPYWLELMLQEWDAHTEALPGKARVRNRSALTGNQLHFITVPYFSRRFELLRFFYAPYVAVSGVPIYDLRSPWDWHVVWHEMAGHLVQVMTSHRVIARLADKINTGSADDIWATWRTLYEHAPGAADDTHPWEQVNPADFVAELLEDAYCVISLGTTTLSTLTRVLPQHYESSYGLADLRHPSMQMRIDMAAALLLDLGNTSASLSELGVTPEQLERCTQLLPGIRMLHATLVGNEDQAMIVQRKEQLLNGQVEAVERHLLAGASVEGTPSIPTLIAAARLAFEAHPEEHTTIAERAMQLAGQAADTFALNASALKPAKPLPLPDQQFFTDLVAGQSWQQLLQTSFQTVDFATPFGHPHPHGEITLRFSSDDGTPHAITHNQFEHG